MDKERQVKDEKKFISPEKTSLHFDRETGKLYKFNKSEVSVVRFGKPYPAAYKKTKSCQYWSNYNPTSYFPFLFRKPSVEMLNDKNEQAANFAHYRLSVYNQIVTFTGKEEVEVLKPFTSFPPNQSRHWFLYCFMLNCGEYAREVLTSNPALGFLFAAHGVFHPLKSKQYWRSARALLKKKRKEILDYFGFPRQESVVKIFAKIDPCYCIKDRFFDLRKDLNEDPEYVRRLSFFDRHNKETLYLLKGSLYKKFDFNLINDIGRNNMEIESEELVMLFFDALRMQHVLEENGIPAKNLYFRKALDVRHFHDELVQTINTITPKKEHFYAQPPLPNVRKNDFYHIEAIRNSLQLYLEGNEMIHCISSFDDKLMEGKYCVAKMLYPERLTILYKQNRDKCVAIDVRAKRNAAPQKESLAIINKWLEGEINAFDNPDQLTVSWDEESCPSARQEHALS